MLRYLYNGNIITGNPAAPRAGHMLVAGDRIWHCDDSVRVLGLDFQDSGFGATRRQLAGDVEFVDLHGRTVIPGLIDSHVHFIWWALNLQIADLNAARSEDEAVELLRAHVAKTKPAAGEWIEGFGWCHNLWREPRLPSRRSLDAAFPDHPVLLSSKCGHLTWSNSAALAAGGIDDGTGAPAGGEIERGNGSNSRWATGILKETASSLVRDRIPAPTDAMRRRALEQGQALAHSFGLTGMQTPEDLDTWGFLQRAHAERALSMRVNFWIPVDALDHLVELQAQCGLGDERLRIAAVKLFSDGSLGGRTALMHEPYEGELANYGIVVAEPEEIAAATLKANRAGLPMAIHAIGDKAVSNVLDAYELAEKELGVNGARCGAGGGERGAGGVVRNRIEHLQVFAPRDLERLRRLKPIASMQPVHLCADMGPADRFWGARSRWAYAFRTLADAGVPLAFGSDAPVEPINPFYGIYAAVTRRALDGGGAEGGGAAEGDGEERPARLLRARLSSGGAGEGWYEEERISVEEALAGYTRGAAESAGQGGELGSLEAGKLADFVVLGKDLFGVSAEELRDVRPVATFSGGRCVYSGEGWEAGS